MKRRLLSAAVFVTLIALPAVADDESGASHPDLSGYWNLPYVPNMAQGKEDTVPYTPAGKAAFVNHDSKDDPTGFCLYPGVPRIMQSPYPVQFVQTGGAWNATSQNACQGTQDSVGVYLLFRHPGVTQAFFDHLGLSSYTVMRFEPIPVMQAGGCK